ncbi:hypothetical protein ACHAPT_000535 [Fusarium lateritium]
MPTNEQQTAELKMQPWKSGMIKNIDAICPFAHSVPFEQGQTIVMGRPHRYTQGTLYDTGSDASDDEAASEVAAEDEVKGQ